MSEFNDKKFHVQKAFEKNVDVAEARYHDAIVLKKWDLKNKWFK